MSNRSKGAHLWLRPATKREPATWFILDGRHQRRTGCGPLEIRDAEQKLAEYIREQHDPRASLSAHKQKEIRVVDVINVYADEIAPTHSNPKETARRLKNILAFFGNDTLDDLNGVRFRAYARHRRAMQAARRELQDFRAALNHFFADELVPPKINVAMPEKGPPRERWMTRSEAAKLLWTAWRRSQPVPKGKHGEVRYVARHIARFILVGLYTGTRASAICGASLKPIPGRGYIDLEKGIFYRRPPGERETTKRRPPVRLPDALLAHIRRWHRLGLCKEYVVEWCGEPVIRVSKGFRAVADAAELPDVTPHTLRHTAITWSMQDGTKLWAASAYFGVSVEILERVYGHHHPGTHAELLDDIKKRRARRLEAIAS